MDLKQLKIVAKNLARARGLHNVVIVEKPDGITINGAFCASYGQAGVKMRQISLSPKTAAAAFQRDTEVPQTEQKKPTKLDLSGNAKRSIKVVKACKDADALRVALGFEDRGTVKRAIEKRLEELEA